MVWPLRQRQKKTEEDSPWMHESRALRIRVWCMLDNGEEFLLGLRIFYSLVPWGY